MAAFLELNESELKDYGFTKGQVVKLRKKKLPYLFRMKLPKLTPTFKEKTRMWWQNTRLMKSEFLARRLKFLPIITSKLIYFLRAAW